jgi:hypothetical protein
MVRTNARCVETIAHPSPVGAFSNGINIRNVCLHVVANENTTTRRALNAALLGKIITRSYANLE